jgi:hypothetical protein
VKFVNAVRQQNIWGPTSSEFSLSRWRQGVNDLADDEHDHRLGRAGEWIYTRLKATRNACCFVNSADVSPAVKLRAIVAFANMAALELWDETKAALNELHLKERRLLYDDMIGLKVTLAAGNMQAADDTLESLVSAIQMALRLVLKEYESGSKTGRSGQTDPGAVHADVNLAILYTALESAWARCLWEDFEIIGQSPSHIRSTDVRSIDWFVATRHRQEALTQGLLSITREHLERGFGRSHRWRVTDVRREGRRQTLVLRQSDEVTWIAIVATTMRVVVRQQYYGELWQERSTKVPSINLEMLLQAWEIVASASDFLRHRLSNASHADVSVQLEHYAPSLHVDALCGAFRRAMGVSLAVARALIECLTYKGERKKGEPRQDLWAQPLVQVSKDRVLPIMVAACSSEMRRVLDIWLAQLGINVTQKGHVFAAHVRTVVADTLCGSRTWCNARVLPADLKYMAGNGREVEIDLVIVIGSLVIVGESKCTTQPDEQQDWHRHRKYVRESVGQLLKAISTIERDKAHFREQVAKRGIQMPEVFRLQPLLVLNSAIHAGVECQGVPVIDLPMLETFFCGFLLNGSVERSDGGFDIVERLVLYADEVDAVAKLSEYLRSPPQLRRIWKSLSDCSIELPSAEAPDVPDAIVHFREVAVDSSRFALTAPASI